MNFGAGMTGGLAWIYDKDGKFIQRKRFHSDFIDPISFALVSDEAKLELRSLIEKHSTTSESSLAAAMLVDWTAKSASFVMLSPKPQT